MYYLLCKKETKKTIFNCSFVQKKPRKNKLEHNETGHPQGLSENKTEGMTLIYFLLLEPC